MNREINIKKFSNAQLVRLHNKRIVAILKEQKVGISLQAILPDSEMSFDGNIIRGNYKRTVFGLSMDAAWALYSSLGYVLKLYQDKENVNENPELIKQ